MKTHPPNEEPTSSSDISDIIKLAQELLKRITFLEKHCTCATKNRSTPIPNPASTPGPQASDDTDAPADDADVWTNVKRRRKDPKTINPTRENKNPTPTSPTKEPGPQPIILHDAAHWPSLAERLTGENLQWTRARSDRSGVRVQMPDNSALERATRLLEEAKFAFHLKTQWPVRAVLRGIPTAINIDAVKEDLTKQGFHVLKATRMCDRRNDKPFPLVHVTIATGVPDIFKVRRIIGLNISAEKPRHVKRPEGREHRTEAVTGPLSPPSVERPPTPKSVDLPEDSNPAIASQRTPPHSDNITNRGEQSKSDNATQQREQASDTTNQTPATEQAKPRTKMSKKDRLWKQMDDYMDGTIKLSRDEATRLCRKLGIEEIGTARP